MNKRTILIIVAVVAVIGLVTVVFTRKTDAPVTTSVNDPSALDIKLPEDISDACTILTRAEVEAAFGVRFNEPKADGESTSDDGLKGGSCVFEQISEDTATGLQNRLTLKVSFDSYNNDDNAQAALERTKSTASVNGRVYFIKTDVPDVGDDAFFFQNQTPAVLKTEDYLYARTGSQVVHFVAVKLSGIDHEATQEAITTLAAQALN